MDFTKLAGTQNLPRPPPEAANVSWQRYDRLCLNLRPSLRLLIIPALNLMRFTSNG